MSLSFLCACSAPSARLWFPTGALERSPRGWFYDLHHHGRADFALLPDERGKLDLLSYDDDGDGRFDRTYRLSDYANEDVPHLLVLLDSLPYQKIEEAYKNGRLAWFDPPQKVISPFPTMTELIYTRILGAPPLPGIFDQYYDRQEGKMHDNLLHRALNGDEQPWERRLHYHATMFESGLAYLDPRPWFAAELQRAKETFDNSPDRVTLVYFSSASSMMSKYGARGFDEIIDGVERMCLEILCERQGAVKISITADHGHNLMSSTNVHLGNALSAAGFHPAKRLQKPDDVVLELDGLVTYAGIRTTRPAAVARVLARLPQIELAIHQEGERVIIENDSGSAAVECRSRKVRYVPIDFDVLGYGPVIEKLRGEKRIDADGFVSDEDWFSATLDHRFPDAPRRVWDAFHGAAANVPEVMLTMKDGWCAGLPEYEKFIHMASTHGGLNQINTATFVMSMTGRANRPIRSKELIQVLEPGYLPPLRH